MKITDERLQELTSQVTRDITKVNDLLQANLKEHARLAGELTKIRSYCPHAIVKHHPRQIAEDDPYDECEICGAQGSFGGPR